MVAFKPKEKPYYARVISNTAFQLSTIAAVVVSFFFVIHHQQKLELATRISEIEEASPNEIIQRNNTVAKRADLASSATPIEAASESTAALDDTAVELPIAASERAIAANSAVQVASALPAGAPTSTNAGTSASGAKAVATSGSVKVSFDEIPRTLLTELINDPDSGSGTYGTLSYGVSPDWATRTRNLSAIPNFHALDSTSPQSLGVGETTTVYRGPRDESAPEQLGIWIYIKLVRADENGSTLAVEVSRSLLDPGATGDLDVLSRLPLPEVTVPKGGAMFVAGLLPHRPAPLTPNELRLYRNDPVLRVITSEAFHGGYTELGILIEPK